MPCFCCCYGFELSLAHFDFILTLLQALCWVHHEDSIRQAFLCPHVWDTKPSRNQTTAGLKWSQTQSLCCQPLHWLREEREMQDVWKHLTESEQMDMWSLVTTQGLVEQVLAYAVIWRMQGELCFQSPLLFSSIPAGRAKFASLWNQTCVSPRSSLMCVVFRWQLHPPKRTC